MGDGRSTGEAASRRTMLGLGLGLAVAGAASAADLKNAPSPITRKASPGRFAGKVVLITGATSGIGKATAHAFAMEGAKVMFCGRREALGAEVQAAIRSAGGEATYRKADVRVDEEVAALVAACVKTYGGLDVAFNNAGIGQGGAVLGSMDWKAHNNLMETNLNGVLRGMDRQVPALRARGGGAIINTASVLGYAGNPQLLSYSLSKAGVLSATRSAALQLARDNIRVNAVSPGPIDTPMMGGGAADASGKRTPAGRAGQPEEIARAVMYLASDEASYVTGEDLRVDGGLRAS
ncbi:glucose 1-dehydrogenase [Phenylobacterium sp. LH3H17]|uniref:SDR family NAD(P)-dependent oxidoreductase n=1 Tax=Phenylobacterium sp. LH3H17 TaxID=2903901 RepID=UPI0020CA1D64|nr:glucose 1-dehydrogenase [Phenylobacterium sp. LH3H17]UTP37771.1 glucose 1-dehydrogenase [Phenylobacterium sp. LH3H17]